MKGLICDDNATALKRYADLIRQAFRRCSIPLELDEYNDSMQVLRRLEESYHYNIYFLDVDMPGCDGLQLGEALRSLSSKPYIIYLSNHESYVFDSFKVQPFRFLRKRCIEEDLEEAVLALGKKLHQSGDRITVHAGKKTYNFDPDKLLYIESRNKILHFVTDDEPIQIRGKIGEMEEQMRKYGFVRVHKSYLINHRFILRLQRKEAELTNEEIIPVGNKHYEQARDAVVELSL